ncbi:hypothetical protein N9876_00245 [bacterium]|nr:hypothetical protein [bacterium]
MDTSLNLPATQAIPSAPSPVLDRSVTTKLAPIDAQDSAATRPTEKPFVAQVVNARLSGVDFPQNPSEITPQDRTLRPYDVPMLPYSAKPPTPEATGQTGHSGAPLISKTEP